MEKLRMKFCIVHRFEKYGTEFGKQLGGLVYGKRKLTASFQKIKIYDWFIRKSIDIF